MPFDPNDWKFPSKEGLYDPSYEKDACGVGFVVSIDCIPSKKIIHDAQKLSQRMEHRGASSADNDTGDGAGTLVAIPHKFFHKQASASGITLPSPGNYATGIFFVGIDVVDEVKTLFEEIASKYDMNVIWWRKVPVDNSCLGEVASKVEPYMIQPFVVSKTGVSDDFDQRIFILRKFSTHNIPTQKRRFYICSLSSKTIVYKGQFSPCQVWKYFKHDLHDPDFLSHVCIVHTRFSTNTFPSWERAHPHRYLAHNGEINTLRGNVNLMRAREGVMSNQEFGEKLSDLYPVVEPEMSDSGCLDNVLEFLTMAGNRSLPEAVMTMVPEAWQNDPMMPDYKKNFYKFAASTFEPWDGPALLTFCDGRYVGAILDRNGLRPSRYYLTSENIMVMASEVGVYDCPTENIIQKGRLMPGKMLLVDTETKCIIQDDELKKSIAHSRPHDLWWKEHFTMEDFRNANKAPIRLEAQPIHIHEPITSYSENQNEFMFRLWKGDRRMPVFGYTIETIQMLMIPMFNTKKEAIGSMGNDAPLACLSNMQPLVYEYFKQLFAQVTNPPIDPFREKIVMSLSAPIGPEGNALEPNSISCHRLWLDQPIISLRDMEIIKFTNFNGWKTKIIDITYKKSNGPLELEKAITRVCFEAEEAAKDYQFIVLCDRGVSPDKIPISAILAGGSVHQHLIKKRFRSKCALILETGEIREIHQICVTIGYGIDAICPYMVFEIAQILRTQSVIDNEITDNLVYDNYVAAVSRGISKVMAKMGISTIQSYKGAQIFEAVGLADEVISKCFSGTASRIGGVNFEILAKESLQRHCLAFGERECDSKILRDPGFFHYRTGGEKHVNNPSSLAFLQEATKHSNKNAYQKFIIAAMESIKDCTLRGQLEILYPDKGINIDQVEPASEIVKRFATGAMSFGSISYEAHSTLAVAMNRLGGKSNTGEGGENSDRYLNQKPDYNMRSAIKQVASGRFGVTISYLSHADEIQIKMAQGAKPGEGGELPGYKVTEGIAKTRHSVPGVGLISPPPHHDIYSIEDLSQLIYDLKCANPKARISVKLVSEVGVGIVASGVAKGKSEHILISGHDGGTGASSWTGIKGAGLPWELGLAETHQVLTMNNLRSRVVVQADGQMRTGFDVVVAGMLGADEIGFATAPLIVMGCTMMRKCHLNTCPVGIATQDPVLRKKFEGKPEHVVNYFFLLAEEIREMLAKLGLRKFQDLIGRTDFLKHRSENVKGKFLDLNAILHNALNMRPNTNIVAASVKQDFNLEKRLDSEMIEKAKDVIEGVTDLVEINSKIDNYQRAFGSTLSHEISKRYPSTGLPKGKKITINLEGSAGQSFCAFLAHGVKITLIGDSNDYVGKGLSGGEIIVKPPANVHPEFSSENNVIAGNVCLYGATSGKAFFRGVAAERFCVRNSGAIAVVEGIGDHGCEYMTGGRVIILGNTGRNFAAGMSGGIAFVLDNDGKFESRCNKEMVELLQLTEESDISFVEDTLKEFVQETDSQVANRLLANWPESAKRFIKVFPYEYQRALKDQKAKSISKNSKKVENDRNNVEDIESIVKDKEMFKKKQEVLLDKTRGFVKYKRETKFYRDTDERSKDWNEIYDFVHVRRGLKKQAARCMDCGVPFCHSNSYGCPLGNIIPKFNDLVFHDNWKEALNQLLQTNNFPEFTGRVCPAPCEGACVLGINEPAVTIKNIECAIIDRAFEKGWIKPCPPLKRTGKSVAIVGSGPSGLAAADQLNKAGHLVTVYERNNRIGGLLMYGIPTMKLSKAVVQRRVDLLKQEGIIFKTGVNVGKDISANDLKNSNDALLLSCGANWPRDLPIRGRDAQGIHFAMEFLQTWQQAQHGDKVDSRKISAKGLDVIVIGGGDTGCDCIGTSLRQGAKSIVSFEILPNPPEKRAADNPWPQFPRLFKVDYGHEEVKAKWKCSDPRRYNTMSKEFLKDENGRVCGINTIQVKWTKDEKGAWKMVEVPGSEKTYPCQLALLAMGFLGPEKNIISELDLKQDRRSNIDTIDKKFSTDVDGIFAAGDCRRGQSLVVWAITEGRQAAKEIDEYLIGNTLLPGIGGVIHPQTKNQLLNEE